MKQKQQQQQPPPHVFYLVDDVLVNVAHLNLIQISFTFYLHTIYTVLRLVYNYFLLPCFYERIIRNKEDWLGRHTI